MRALVPHAPDDDRDRQQDPDRNRYCEHDESNAENECIHPLVVVVPESRDVPRSRDPPVVPGGDVQVDVPHARATSNTLPAR